MLLVILLQTSHGYGKTQEMFLVAVNYLLLWLLIAVKQALITVIYGMELVTVPPKHVAWMSFVSRKSVLDKDRCFFLNKYIDSLCRVIVHLLL